MIPWCAMFYCIQNLQHCSFLQIWQKNTGPNALRPCGRRSKHSLMKHLLRCLFRAVISHVWFIFKHVYVRTTVEPTKWLACTLGTNLSGAYCWVSSIPSNSSTHDWGVGSNLRWPNIIHMRLSASARACGCANMGADAKRFSNVQFGFFITSSPAWLLARPHLLCTTFVHHSSVHL